MGRGFKKIVVCVCLTSIFVSGLQAYIYNDKVFNFVKCEFGKSSFKSGYTGYYQSLDGESISIFFGDDYCEI